MADVKEDEIDFTNQRLLRLKRTLLELLRRDRSDRFTGVVRNANNVYREKIKRNQIVPTAIEEDEEDSRHNECGKRKRKELKKRIEEAKEEYNMYSFGEEFCYGYQGELGEMQMNYCTKVLPGYDSLKDEILSNRVSKLTIEQFNCEYQKA
eukprot:581672_1